MPPRSVLLVHGAFAGPWIRDEVSRELEGHSPMLSRPSELVAVIAGIGAGE